MVLIMAVTDLIPETTRVVKDLITDLEIQVIREIKTKITTVREDLEIILPIQTANTEILLTTAQMVASETIREMRSRIILSKTTIPTEVVEDLDKTIINKKTNS